jgi:hypothetical protein
MAKKNPLTTPNSTPKMPKPVEPEPATAPPLQVLHITITGNSALTKILAQRTDSRLRAFLDSDHKRFRNLQSVNGQIKILSIKERWQDKDNALNINISAGMSGRVILKDTTRYKFKLTPVTSGGPEPMQQQLTSIATQMVENLGKFLQNPPGKGQITIKIDPVKTAPPTNSVNRRDKSILRNKPDRGFE